MLKLLTPLSQFQPFVSMFVGIQKYKLLRIAINTTLNVQKHQSLPLPNLMEAKRFLQLKAQGMMNIK